MLEVLEPPYPRDALAPHVSARTLDVHYEKHHKGYLRALEKLVRGKPEESLEELIRHSHGELFDKAAQLWNHNFLWRSTEGGKPEGHVRNAGERRTAAHTRRLRARILPRLSERSRALRARFPGPPCELGLHRRESGSRADSFGPAFWERVVGSPVSISIITHPEIDDAT